MWVSNQTCHFFHVRIRPNIDLMLTVSMGWYNFLSAFAECKVTDLRAGILFTKYFSSKHIPHFNHSICSATSCCQQSMLMRRPGYCLDSSSVISELIQDLTSCWPYHYFIVITSWSQALFIERPFEATNLLGMFLHQNCRISSYSEISLQNGLIPGTCC